MNKLLLVLAAILAGFSSAAAQAPDTAMRVEPATIQIRPGESVEVTIQIADVENLGAFQFDLTYDPTVVEIDNVTLGDFPGSTGRSVNPLGPRIDAGKATYGAFSFGDAAGPAGSGTLAVVTLQAVAGGQSPLGLQNVQVIDVGGAQMGASTEGGQVMVPDSAPAPQATGTAVPREPTRIGTATATAVLTPPEPPTSRDMDSEPSSVLREWLITVGALVGLVLVVILVARQMAATARGGDKS